MECSIDRIARAVRSSAERVDVERVYLFGSYARGDASEGSDVDLCIETGPTFSLVSAGEFVASLEGDLDAPVDIATERSLFPAVRAAMLEDRVLLYERA